MNKFLTPALVLATVLISANATIANAIPMTDFEDGTTAGWGIGARGDGSISVTNEMEDSGNHYLKYNATGGPTDESRIALMAGDDYMGNWSKLGKITSITARMRNLSDKTLTMHAAFGNSYSDLRTRYASAGVEIANDGEWHDVVFSLTDDLHLVSKGGHGKSSADFTVAEVMGNITDLRFTHGVFGETYEERRGPFEGFNAGEALTAELWVDDIKLSAIPVPGAVWLFTSAIAGLLVSRKRLA